MNRFFGYGGWLLALTTACATPAGGGGGAVEAVDGGATVAFDASTWGSAKDSGATDATNTELDSSSGADHSPSTSDGADGAGGSNDGSAPADAGTLDTSTPRVASCGDGECNGSEKPWTCAQDCPAPPAVCGDGWCQPPECGLDCDPSLAGLYLCAKAKCAGVAACVGDPDCQAALDGGLACLAGDSKPDFCVKLALGQAAAQSAIQCAATACANVQPQGVCGDGECLGSESGATCPQDCSGGGACGDGVCSASESASSCPADCAPASGCGDGTCSPGETPATCAADCASPAMCGDGQCQVGETLVGCVFDCDPATAPKTACGYQKCPDEATACFSDPGCVKALKDSHACLQQCGSGSDACLQKCASPVLANDKAKAYAVCGLMAGCQ
jgi:hypothetical protein